MKKSTHELTITGLAHGGAGVAHVELNGERRAVFVARTAPGDRVRAEVDFGARPARGRTLAILEPGPARVAPPCADVERCGACDWMHLDRAAQETAHRTLVREALPEAMRSAPLRFHSAKDALGYRVRARVHARSAQRQDLAIGFFGAGTHDPILVQSCVILAPALEEARRALPALLAGVRGRGEIQLALGAGGKPVAEIVFERDLAPEIYARADALVTSGAWAGARIFGGGTKRPATIGRPEPILRGADGHDLVLAAGGFSQAHGALNEALARAVDGSVPEGLRVLELYAGAGNLTVLLADGRKGRKVQAVESDEGACEAARKNLRARSLTARVTAADAEVHPIEAGVQAIVLDPPRTGARAACTALASGPSSVRHVTYVSCDGPTLGRDLELLAPRFELASIDLFEMFPQTSHVEIVAVLNRRARTRETA